jgi:molybdate transport system substrate-binding protein
MKSIFAGCLVAAALAAQPAQAAELKVMTGGSMTGAFAELVPQFERASGHKLKVFYGGVPQMIKRTVAGEPFDVGIVPRQVLKDAGAGAKFAPGPTVRIGSVGYGIAVRAGAPKPDIGTAEALKQTLLKAQSVAFFPDSAAGAYVMKVFDRLGIGEAMKAKTKAQPDAGQIVQAVAKGDAELGIFLINVFAAPGVDIAGPFPADLQDELIFEGALAADTKQADAAKAFVEFLRKPEAMAVFKSKGMSPG